MVDRSSPESETTDIVDRLRSVSGCTQKTFMHRLDWEDGRKIINEAASEIENLRNQAWKYLQECGRLAQTPAVPAAWRITDGEGDYEYLTEEPSESTRAWSRRYGREWEPLYSLADTSTDRQTPFYGAQCPSYPNCTGGCGLGCTHEIEQARRRTQAERGNRFCKQDDCPYPDCLVEGGICPSQPPADSSPQENSK